ncbi:hypothetical protein CIW47_02860 [Mycolicibacterium sp. P1-5]|nr:hypothetical protein [Mycolicibacterium sp. P1-5]KAA0112177.1 hypothetical protein CIW47_02860 [Mycolicibacterium sp. P1-5]
MPTKTLPLIAWAGPLAPVLDKKLRPIIEAAYHRPVDIPDPNLPAPAAVEPARPAVMPAKAAPTKRAKAGSAGAKSTSPSKVKGSTASSARRR